MKLFYSIFIYGLFFSHFAVAQVEGPIIFNNGATYAIESPDFNVDTSLNYNIVFDITDMPDDPSQINRSINSIARFINMQVRNGMDLKNSNLVGVIHSKAIYSILNDRSYNLRYQMDNPNAQLLQELSRNGVQFMVCGQSIYARNLNEEMLSQEIKIALSAMTVLATLQLKGYAFIPL